METNRINIGFFGSSGCGKNSYVRRVVYNKYSDTSSVSLGPHFEKMTFEAQGTQYSLHIWSFPGNQRFWQQNISFLKNQDAIVLCCDLTDKETDSLYVDRWVKQIRTATDAPIFLMYTKSDSSAMRVCEPFKTELPLAGNVSAKTGTGCIVALDRVVKYVLKERSKKKETSFWSWITRPFKKSV